jgi:hypothetical protein
MGRLVNMSLSGGAIETSLDLRIFSRIQLAPTTAHRSAHATRMISAYVVRKYPGGVGIEWCDFAPQAIAELMRTETVVRSARKQPAGVQAVPVLQAAFKHGT